MKILIMNNNENQKKNKLPEKLKFNLWYNDIIERAGIMDIRYPIKGLYVWYPFGFKIRKLVFSIIKKLMDSTGHEEVLFPTLIPKTEFMKESLHIQGFEKEVYWITKGGNTKLDIDLALRPTSETSIYPIFKLWIRSHIDLPIKIYQIVNTFRYETKSTKPLIRLREITSFKEAHTVHETESQSNSQIKKAINIYNKFFSLLCISTLNIKRPFWDKFPGSDYTIAFDTIMPDGKSLQVGTVHNLGTNFSKTYDIKYEDKNGIQKYVFQTCYGISERCIASLIAIHGDDNGLVLPPNIAPIQVVIIPIVSKLEKNNIYNECKRIYYILKKNNIRVYLDDSEQRPGYKYYKWELKGVCLRLEIGSSEVKENTIILVNRSTKIREKINKENLLNIINIKLKEEEKILFSNSIKLLKENISYHDNINDIINKNIKSVIKVPLCDSEKCGIEIEGISKLTLLGHDLKDHNYNNCIVCKNKTKYTFYLSKKY